MKETQRETELVPMGFVGILKSRVGKRDKHTKKGLWMKCGSAKASVDKKLLASRAKVK